MSNSSDSRFDPFDDSFVFLKITEESRVCGFDSEAGMFGFRLDEDPRILSGDSLTIREDVTGSNNLEEISSNRAPDAGEYRIDRTFSTGFVQMNSSADGSTFLITYEGKGTILQNRTILTLLAVGRLIVNILTITDDLLMPTGGAFSIPSDRIEYNGVEVLGFADDGTPIFRQWATGSIGSGNTQGGGFSHGLSTPVINDEIWGAGLLVDDGTNDFHSNTEFNDAAIEDFVYEYHDVNATTVRLTRAGSTTTNDTLAWLDYTV